MSRSRAHTRRKPRSHPRGVLVVRTEGFGFVQTSEGAFFIPRKALGGAFDGDVVEVTPIVDARRGARTAAGRGSNGNTAARVVRVVERAHEVLIGRYEVAEPFGVVVPEDPRIPYDIFTRRADAPQVPDGALVRVRIVEYPTRTSAATGVVEEVLAEGADARAGVEVVIARHKLETSFSPSALEEATSAQLDAAGALAEGYRDLRDRFVFTIDPEDAKDFDDALSICSVGADAPPEPADVAASPDTRSSRDPGGSPTEVGFAPAIPRTSGTRGSLADLDSVGGTSDAKASSGSSAGASITHCGNCSNCSGDFEAVDVTELARAVMRCVQELRGRFGKGVVCDVLRGSKSAKVLELGLDSCKTYGSVDASAAQLKEVIELLAVGSYLLITEGSYPTVGFGPRVREVADDGFSLKMKRVVRKRDRLLGAGSGANTHRGSFGASGTGVPDDPELFERLRVLRKRIADRMGKPPYVVFSDAALRDMCARLPRTDEEFLEVSGVGATKLTRYGDDFLAEINAYLKEQQKGGAAEGQL